MIMVIQFLPTKYGNYCLWCILIQNVDVVIASAIQRKKKGDAQNDGFQEKSM